MAGHFDCTQLAERALGSIFCVEATPLHQVLEDKQNAQMMLEKRIKLVKSKTLPKDAKARAAIGESKPTQDIRSATGFCIARNGSKFRILTCAHMMDDCYAAGVRKFTMEEANSLFYFEVTCSHEEAKVHERLGTRDINKESRDKTPAYCVALDTDKDLMVLQVEEIISGSSGEGEEIEWLECLEPHPLLQMVETPPAKLEPCILMGWPPQSMECNSVGHCSFFARTYSAITQLNPKGYTMRLADLSGIVALDGCSGGPVIDRNRDCLGVYHGERVRGYAVSSLDVREFLDKFGVLCWPDDDEEEEEQADLSAPGQADPPAAGQNEQADPPAAREAGGNLRRSKRNRKPSVPVKGEKRTRHM